MIESDSPIYQTLLGTLFTWGMTAAGAGLVVVISGTQVWSVNLDDSFKLWQTIQAALLTLKEAHKFVWGVMDAEDSHSEYSLS